MKNKLLFGIIAAIVMGAIAFAILSGGDGSLDTAGDQPATINQQYKLVDNRAECDMGKYKFTFGKFICTFNGPNIPVLLVSSYCVSGDDCTHSAILVRNVPEPELWEQYEVLEETQVQMKNLDTGALFTFITDDSGFANKSRVFPVNFLAPILIDGQPYIAIPKLNMQSEGSLFISGQARFKLPE